MDGGPYCNHKAFQQRLTAYELMLSLVLYSSLDHQADVEAKNEEGKTPLHLAAEEGKVPIIQALLNKGANIEANDLENQTPLHLSVEWYHTEAIKTLLKASANIKAKIMLVAPPYPLLQTKVK